MERKSVKNVRHQT